MTYPMRNFIINSLRLVSEVQTGHCIHHISFSYTRNDFCLVFKLRLKYLEKEDGLKQLHAVRDEN